MLTVVWALDYTILCLLQHDQYFLYIQQMFRNQPSMLKRSSSSPVSTGPRSGLSEPWGLKLRPLVLRAPLATAPNIPPPLPAKAQMMNVGSKSRYRYVRVVAAEYDNREKTLSRPPSELPIVPCVCAENCTSESNALAAPGDVLCQSPGGLCACPNALVPGEYPPAWLNAPGVDGDAMTGGGRAWILEYPAARPWGSDCPGACACQALMRGKYMNVRSVSP